jgi:hypothetical protein
VAIVHAPVTAIAMCFPLVQVEITVSFRQIRCKFQPVKCITQFFISIPHSKKKPLDFPFRICSSDFVSLQFWNWIEWWRKPPRSCHLLKDTQRQLCFHSHCIGHNFTKVDLRLLLTAVIALLRTPLTPLLFQTMPSFQLTIIRLCFSLFLGIQFNPTKLMMHESWFYVMVIFSLCFKII